MAHAAAGNSSFPILTPVTYLNYLTPQDVRVYEVSRNVFLAVVGAAIMEWLEHLPTDIKLMKMGINPTVIAYLLSRPGAILFGLLAIISKSPNASNCESLMIGEFVCCFVAMSTSAFLFLQRVQAVWEGNKIIKVVFTLIWLVGVAFDAVLFDVTHAAKLADTDYCVIAKIKTPWGAAAPIVGLVFDTLVFLCISYKIATTYQYGPNGEVAISWRTILSGEALPRLARSVLKGGQQFYLIAVICNIFLVIFMSLHITSLEEAVAPTAVAIIIISMAACRVFRNLRVEGMTLTEVHTTATIKFGIPTSHDYSRGGTNSSNAASSTFYSSTTRPTESSMVGHEPGTTHTIIELVESDPEQKV